MVGTMASFLFIVVKLSPQWFCSSLPLLSVVLPFAWKHFVWGAAERFPLTGTVIVTVTMCQGEHLESRCYVCGAISISDTDWHFVVSCSFPPTQNTACPSFWRCFHSQTLFAGDVAEAGVWHCCIFVWACALKLVEQTAWLLPMDSAEEPATVHVRL